MRWYDEANEVRMRWEVDDNRMRWRRHKPCASSLRHRRTIGTVNSIDNQSVWICSMLSWALGAMSCVLYPNTDNDKQHITTRTLKEFLNAKREFDELYVRDWVLKKNCNWWRRSQGDLYWNDSPEGTVGFALGSRVGSLLNYMEKQCRHMLDEYRARDSAANHS